MKKRYLAIMVAAALTKPLMAEEIQALDTTVVEAKKSSNIEISAKELKETQVNDIKGVFKEVAAVNVSNSTRYSQKTYIRGVEEHSANVTIDGARQDGQQFHHSGNQKVDTSMLKSASVELGASSVLSGYGANIGAIKYVTVDPLDRLVPQQKFGFSTSASMDTATEFTQVNASAYGMLTKKLSVLGSVNWNESGDIEIPDSDPIINKHSKLNSGLVKLVYDFSDVEQLDFSAQRYDDSGYRAYSGEKPGVTTQEEITGYAGEVFNAYVRDTYTLAYHNNSDNPLLDLSVNAYFNKNTMDVGTSSGDNWYRDSDGKWHKDGVATEPKQAYINTTVGLDVRNTFLISDIAWTAGLETFKSKQEITASALKQSVLANGTSKSEDISVSDGPESTLIGTYLQAELKFGDFTVVPGLRYDSYKLGGAYDSSFDQISPKLTLDWQANDDLVLKMGYGSIFKGPGLPETSSIQRGMKESLDAKAETGDHLEFNLIQNLQSIIGADSASMYVNLYHYTIDNTYHPTKNNSLVRNTYDLTMAGVEAGFNFNHQDLGMYINYSFNQGENAYQDYTTDNLYSGTHVVKLGADYQVTEFVLVGFNSNLSSSARLNRTSIEDGNVENEVVKKVGYGVTDIWLDYQVAQVEGLSAQFAVENVFDKAYQNHNSFGMYWGNAGYNNNEVGRNFKLTANYQF